MPSPAHPSKTTTRGGGTKLSSTKQKALDTGTPLGVHDTNTVREKIRKWQQQGGGVVIAKDACGPNDEENPAPPKPKPTPKREEKKVQSPNAARNRSHSTPKKRVVSDEHWRRQRSAAKAKTTPPKQASPKRISVYTTNDELRAPHEEKKRDVERQERPKSSHATFHGTPLTPSRREQTKAKLPRRPKSVADIIVVEEDSDESAADHDRSLPARRPTSAKVSRNKDISEITDKMRRRTPPPEEDIPWAKSEADFSELSRRRARGPDPKPRPLTKLPKGGIFGQMLDESKKIFSKPEPPKPVPNRGAKIEAWLTNAFDPFLDDGQPPVEVPAPLKTRTRPRPESETEEAEGKPVPNSPDGGDDYRYREGKKMSPKVPKVERARVKEPTTPKANETSSPMSQSSPRSEKAHSRSKSTPTATDQQMSKGSVTDDKLDDSDTETHPFSDGSEVSGNNAPVPIGRRRPFPSTGLHRLSTIASVETFSTHRDLRAVPSARLLETSEPAPIVKDIKPSSAEVTAESQVKPAMEQASEPTKRLATHDDLISVLSLPNTRTKNVRSSRSIRTDKSRLVPVSVDEVLHEISADEAKYMRELKTLVGGVIPVLLTCVLSRSESAIAAGLFRPAVDPRDDVNFTKPIVDMGVASERLKALHKRIPLTDLDALLTWAFSAQRVYREYLRAWRLGFKDVIVNLAPSDDPDSANNADTKSLDEGMARDANGDIVDSDGDKVDVAYLLKRPLVRLKYLAKTFRGVNALRPSIKAEEIASAFEKLVVEARRRAREERARLEDESAACIDSTRARDPRTLGVLTGVTVDSTRRVRARDFFNLSLYHTSGQIMDCRAELLLRDNPPGSGPGGDLLICEIDHTARWLLFPPIETSCVSARKGSVNGEIVIMLRSSLVAKDKWQELLSLQIDEEEVGIEWVQLLGTDPTPPALSRRQSFMNRSKADSERSDADDALPSVRRGPPSPSAINIPIGERADSRRSARRSMILKESSSESSTLESSSTVDSRMSQLSAITRESDYAEGFEGSPKRNSHASLPSSRHFESSESKSPTTLKRSKAKRISRHGDALSSESSSSPRASPSVLDTPTTPDTPRRGQKGTGTRFYESAGLAKEKMSPQGNLLPRPAVSDALRSQPQRISSVPSMDLPTIRKIRRGSGQSHLSGSSDGSSVADNKQTVDDQSTMDDAAPAPPPHRSPPSQQKLGTVAILEPSATRPKRRTSSPLKHEYEPSTASDTYTDSEASTVRQNEYGSSSSESSGEDSDGDEVASIADSVDIIDPIRPTVQASMLTTAASTLSPSNSASQKGYRTVPSQPSKATKAIASIFAWSDKGSWESLHIDECSILVSPGLIEAYEMSSAHSDPNDGYENESDKPQPLIALELTPLVPIRRGTAIDISIRSPPTERSKITSSGNVMFRSRNSDECEGLYRLINQARINNPTYIALQNARGPFADMPLNLDRSNKASWLGWPKRRRSYRASANAPRSLAEASDSSVGTMSSAFSALKRFSGSKMFNTSRSTDTSQKGGGSGSLHSSSAASGSHHSPFTSRGIERIAAAMKGADGIGLSNAKIRLYVRETQSKWRDMGAARLTIMPVDREREPELERGRDSPRPKTAASSQSDASGSGSASSGADRASASAPVPAPPDTEQQQQQTSPPTSGSSSPRREPHPNTLVNLENAKKRILIRGKTRGEVLLDVCLGESSFERVARTGIAVSVWGENEGGAIANKGGVVGGSFSVYMIQMKSEAEAAYTFGLVGKLRY